MNASPSSPNPASSGKAKSSRARSTRPGPAAEQALQSRFGPIGDGWFIAGTPIARAGEDMIETSVDELRPGDRLLTLAVGGTADRPASGRPIRAIARREIDIATHPIRDLVTPVRILADALAPGLPQTDLVLPSDALLRIRNGEVDDQAPSPREPAGHLVPVGALLNGASILREPPTGNLIWYALDLGAADIIRAAGTPIGSFRDLPSASSASTPPRPAPCLKLLLPGPDLAALRKRLANRAVTAGLLTGPASEPDQPVATPSAIEPDPNAPTPLRIVAGGIDIVLENSPAPGILCFQLPAKTGPIRLMSNTGKSPVAHDNRLLGVCVHGIELDSSPLEFTSTAYGPGFHPEEHDSTASWRWTNGEAWLVLPYSPNPRSLLVRITDWHRHLRFDSDE
jgi:hypothetical protein